MRSLIVVRKTLSPLRPARRSGNATLLRDNGRSLAPAALLPPLVQAKLRIGAPNDQYEQEADRVADQVMCMPEPTVDAITGIGSGAATPDAQRKCAACESGGSLCPACAEEEKLRRQPVEEEEEELLQTKSTGDAVSHATLPVQAQIDSMRGGGQPLPEDSRQFFEARFGEDFSTVRIQHDSSAAGSAQALQASAFTVGRDIAFGSGHYSPNTPKGKTLIAHELTHVLQQNSLSPRNPLVPKRVQRQENSGPLSPGGYPIEVRASPGGAGPASSASSATPDSLTSDPATMEQFYCLWKASSYGMKPQETAAWITRSGSNTTFSYWPITEAFEKQTFKGTIPGGTFAYAHTHPNTSGEQPSTADRDGSKRLGYPLYVVTGNAIWRTDGTTDTQVAPDDWWKPYKKAKC